MNNKIKLGILTSHPIQYQVPLFRELAKSYELKVYYMQDVTPEQQANAGFGVKFQWDIDLYSGYDWEYLENKSSNPGVNKFWGCNTPSISSKIKSENFNVFLVTGWYLYSYIQGILACRRYKVPLLVRGDSQLITKRSSLKKIIKKYGYRLFMKLFSGFLIVGQRAKEYFKYYGVDERKMFSVPHFIDNDFFSKKSIMSSEEISKMKEGLELNNDEKILLFVGKFIPKKRPLDILYAIKILHEKGINCTGLYVGAGELENEIKELASTLEIKIKIVGFKNQSELPKYYAISDLLVLPSDAGETWGLVANEALACGLRIVVSDETGCSPDLINAGITGKIYRAGDTIGLATAIEKLIKTNVDTNVKKKIADKISEYSLERAVIGINQAIKYVVKS